MGNLRNVCLRICNYSLILSLSCLILFQSQANFEEKIITKGKERKLIMIIVLAPNPLTSSELDCKLTYALKQ